MYTTPEEKYDVTDPLTAMGDRHEEEKQTYQNLLRGQNQNKNIVLPFLPPSYLPSHSHLKITLGSPLSVTSPFSFFTLSQPTLEPASISTPLLKPFT